MLVVVVVVVGPSGVVQRDVTGNGESVTEGADDRKDNRGEGTDDRNDIRGESSEGDSDARQDIRGEAFAGYLAVYARGVGCRGVGEMLHKFRAGEDTLNSRDTTGGLGVGVHVTAGVVAVDCAPVGFANNGTGGAGVARGAAGVAVGEAVLEAGSEGVGARELGPTRGSVCPRGIEGSGVGELCLEELCIGLIPPTGDGEMPAHGELCLAGISLTICIGTATCSESEGKERKGVQYPSSYWPVGAGTSASVAKGMVSDEGQRGCGSTFSCGGNPSCSASR